MNQYGKPFLTADWRYLALLNYESDPALLQPMVPAGTELDTWKGKTFVSMVGFSFLNTRVLGLAIPLHENFEEINLRFYVRHKADDGWRRGVVFIKEIVPRAAIAWVARRLYNENYVALPTGHSLVHSPDDPMNIASARYFWTFERRGQFLQIVTAGAPSHFVEGSAEEFIAQHYWGYTTQRDGGTMEYRVDHPEWRIWQARSARLEGDVAKLYGERFAEVLRGTPSSAFLAEGSEIVVYRGRKLV